MNEIVEILIMRDGLSKKEAEKKLTDAQIRIYEGEDPRIILSKDFRLGAEYLKYLV